MDYPVKHNIRHEEIDNGALVLLLLRECNTWEALCERYINANPNNLRQSTNALTLRNKLLQMRDLGLISFEHVETKENGKIPVGEITETDLWTQIRVAFGGMTLSEAAMISCHAKGMAVAPIFGRPKGLEDKIDIFVLMPFKAKLEKVYTEHIKRLGEELGLVIRRADDIFLPMPFMDKVWSGIYAAGLVIADCTEKNPNVFYEIGMAHTVGKKVVLITRSEKDIPSDIKHFDYLPYVYDLEGVQTLVEKLRTFIKNYFKL